MCVLCLLYRTIEGFNPIPIYIWEVLKKMNFQSVRGRALMNWLILSLFFNLLCLIFTLSDNEEVTVTPLHTGRALQYTGVSQYSQSHFTSDVEMNLKYFQIIFFIIAMIATVINVYNRFFTKRVNNTQKTETSQFDVCHIILLID